MKDIRVSRKVAERIRTSKDLGDYYNYMETHTGNEWLSYSWPKDQQHRINNLVEGINYINGWYDEDNVKRILGKETL